MNEQIEDKSRLEPESQSPEFHIRPLRPDDSVEELTGILHRAYGSLAARGMKYFATHQTPQQTQDRLASGDPYVAELDGQLVGTITLYTEDEFDNGPDWYERPDVGWFGQFGLEPHLQGKGYGNQMLAFIEERAREKGLNELALDTAETADNLIEWYGRHGWRQVEMIDWPVTNYVSVVMSKSLV